MLLTLFFLVSLQDLKKVKIAVESLYFEKQKLEKPASKKTSTKGKIKATIKAQDDVSFLLIYLPLLYNKYFHKLDILQ